MICTPNIEMLTLSLRPFHLPRKFPTVVLCCVYIPPSGNANRLQGKYPKAPVFIAGDFNNCRLNKVPLSFIQYVDIPTRKGNILDLCHGNTADAYTCCAHSPLGSSDHNTNVLLPHYRPVMKQHKPQTFSSPQWSEDNTAHLQGALACTDWDIFDGSFEQTITIITDYIAFCINSTIPFRTVKVYLNTKPWITPQLNLRLRERREAFKK